MNHEVTVSFRDTVKKLRNASRTAKKNLAYYLDKEEPRVCEAM